MELQLLLVVIAIPFCFCTVNITSVHKMYGGPSPIGSTPTLVCRVSVGADSRLVWWSRVKPVADIGRHRLSSQRGSARISLFDLSVDDEGWYYCNYNTSSNNTLSAGVYVKVLTRPVMMPLRYTAVKGSNITMHCNGSGHIVSIWYRHGVPVRDGDKYTISNRNGDLLTIYDLDAKDSGNYECVSSNEAFSTTVNISLVVEHKPIFAYTRSAVLGVVGKRMLLVCAAGASPAPVIVWTRNNVTLNDVGIVTDGYNTSAYLFFQSADVSDAGTYTCNASNYLGDSIFHTSVSVEADDGEYSGDSQITSASTSGDLSTSTDEQTAVFTESTSTDEQTSVFTEFATVNSIFVVVQDLDAPGGGDDDGGVLVALTIVLGVFCALALLLLLLILGFMKAKGIGCFYVTREAKYAVDINNTEKKEIKVTDVRMFEIDDSKWAARDTRV